MAESEQTLTRKVNFFLPSRYNKESNEYETEMYTNVAENTYMDFDSEETVGSTLLNLKNAVDELNRTNESYAVCDTAGNVTAKVVNISPFVLQVGAEVSVNFIYPNTAVSVTLNVSGYGAKPVMYKGKPLQGSMLSGLQKFSYDGTNWNVVGDLDTNTDTTYEIMSVGEVLTGSSITARTVNALNLRQTITQISAEIVSASLADSYDVVGLQATLNNLIFRLASKGVIDGDGLDTVVVISSSSDIVLISGIYANGKVYI